MDIKKNVNIIKKIKLYPILKVQPRDTLTISYNDKVLINEEPITCRADFDEVAVIEGTYETKYMLGGILLGEKK
jgi:hypothetical protein